MKLTVTVGMRKMFVGVLWCSLKSETFGVKRSATGNLNVRETGNCVKIKGIFGNVNNDAQKGQDFNLLIRAESF